MITEKRAFYAALAKARKEGVKEFEFHGKTFKVFERFMNFQEFVTEQLNEARAKTSALLKTVADGDSSRVEGTKVSQEQAERLLKIYDLLDTEGQIEFDQKNVKMLLKAYEKELKM